jgi:hypothetical protein
MSRNHQGIPPNAGAVFANTLVNAVARQIPSAHVRRGDSKLDRARQLVSDFISVIAENDRKTIEDRITQ